jgi:hypothetical protein
VLVREQAATGPWCCPSLGSGVRLGGTPSGGPALAHSHPIGAMSERFKGRGKLLKLGAPASAAIDVDFDFAVTRSAGATSSRTVVRIGGVHAGEEPRPAHANHTARCRRLRHPYILRKGYPPCLSRVSLLQAFD